jgi:hypothetical protein
LAFSLAASSSFACFSLRAAASLAAFSRFFCSARERVDFFSVTVAFAASYAGAPAFSAFSSSDGFIFQICYFLLNLYSLLIEDF